jgi:hypothetical protein
VGTVIRLADRRRPGRKGRRALLRIALLVVGLGLAVVAALLLRRRHGPAGLEGAARPVEEHDGLCAAPSPQLAEPVPCPYVGKPGAKGKAIDYGAPFAGEEPGVSCLAGGTLVAPTGQLVAADPLVFLNDRAFTVSVPPGRYPVVLAWTGTTRDDGDVALALLQIRPERPVRWEIAVLPDEKPGAHFYPVDTGTGCYVDRAVAREILARQKAEEDRQLARVKSQGVSPWDGDGWHRAMQAAAAERKDLLELLRLAGYDRRQAASLCIDPATGGNLVVFRSGAGDGSYGVYVGYDASGAVAAFVTDFGILESLEAGDGGG